MLSRLLDGARRARIIDYNPAREVKRPSQDTSTSPTPRALTVQQIRRLLELIPAGVYRRYAAALVFTGMRAGEATAQRVRDADLEQNILRISRSFSPGKNGELIEQSPRATRSGKRRSRSGSVRSSSKQSKARNPTICCGPGRMAAGSPHATSAAPSIGRKSSKSFAAPTCACTTSATPSPPSSSTQEPLRPTCKPCSGTPACKSPNATRAHARVSRGVQGRCSTGSSSQTGRSRRRTPRRAARRTAQRSRGARLRARTLPTRSAIRSEAPATVRAAEMAQEWPKVAEGSACERRDGSCDCAQDDG